jgi:hypothetical protein
VLHLALDRIHAPHLRWQVFSRMAWQRSHRSNCQLATGGRRYMLLVEIARITGWGVHTGTWHIAFKIISRWQLMLIEICFRAISLIAMEGGGGVVCSGVLRHHMKHLACNESESIENWTQNICEPVLRQSKRGREDENGKTSCALSLPSPPRTSAGWSATCVFVALKEGRRHFDDEMLSSCENYGICGCAMTISFTDIFTD